MTRTGWRGLLSYSQIQRWRQWQDEIIEKVDREQKVTQGYPAKAGLQEVTEGCATSGNLKQPIVTLCNIKERG